MFPVLVRLCWDALAERGENREGIKPENNTDHIVGRVIAGEWTKVQFLDEFDSSAALLSEISRIKLGGL
jgi:hypothetical protein